jgi:C4-dicarboxylate-specific signal transduction histidine kinase
MNISKSCDNIDNISLIEREKFSLLGKLSGGLLHNLGTPLMGSSGQLILSDSKIDTLNKLIDDENTTKEELKKITKELKEYNENIRNYTYYMSDILSSVKSYIRNSYTESKFKINLEKLFENIKTLTLFESKIKQVKTIFIMENSGSHAIIKGDYNNLMQITINLVINAIESYKGKKGIVKIISNIKNNNLTISVIDNGCGIDEVTKSKLLNEVVSTKENKGTGIGLYISNQIIKNYFNGKINILSDGKTGTEIIISIPTI